MKNFIIIIIIMTTPTYAFSDWLIYHKPSFEGRVIDVESNLPIEGAAVVVLYEKWTTSFGAGPIGSVIDIRETVTDENGMFKIHSYTTVIQPFSWSGFAKFIIYSPGYLGVDGMNLEAFFSSRENLEVEKKFPWIFNKNLIIRFSDPNTVALPRVKNREDRIRANISPFGDSRYWPQQKKLIKLIRQNWQELNSEDPGDLFMPNGGQND